MDNDKPPEKPTALQSAFSMTPIAVGLEVGCLTLFIVFGSIFGGLLLDKWLGTKPILTILLVVGSAPLALFLTFRLAMREIKKAYPSTPASTGKTQSKYEEDDRE